MIGVHEAMGIATEAARRERARILALLDDSRTGGDHTRWEDMEPLAAIDAYRADLRARIEATP